MNKLAVISDVIQHLKFLGFDLSLEADEVSFYADLVYDRLTENLYIKTIKDPLYNTYIDMICGEILYRKKALGGPEAIGIIIKPKIASKTEDDTTISFSRSGELSAEASLDKYIDKLRKGDPTILDQNRVYKG